MTNTTNHVFIPATNMPNLCAYPDCGKFLSEHEVNAEKASTVPTVEREAHSEVELLPLRAWLCWHEGRIAAYVQRPENVEACDAEYILTEWVLRLVEVEEEAAWGKGAHALSSKLRTLLSNPIHSYADAPSSPPLSVDGESLPEASGELSARVTELEAALTAMYHAHQRLSSPDTRWELPVYEQARVALRLTPAGETR